MTNRLGADSWTLNGIAPVGAAATRAAATWNFFLLDDDGSAADAARRSSAAHTPATIEQVSDAAPAAALARGAGAASLAAAASDAVPIADAVAQQGSSDAAVVGAAGLAIEASVALADSASSDGVANLAVGSPSVNLVEPTGPGPVVMPPPDSEVDWSVPKGGLPSDLVRPDNGAGDPWQWTLGNPPVYTGDARIDGILWGSSWSDGSITYSDPDSTADYQAGYFTTAGYPNFSVGFGQLTANQLKAAHAILNQAVYTQLPASAGLSVEAFTGLNITYAGAGSGAGTIRLANTSSGVVSTARVADFPGGTNDGSAIHGGDVWYGGSGDNPTTGNYDYATTIHELGHALGLKHGHQASNAFGGGAPVLPAATDSMEYSIMTYRSYVGGPTTGYTNETWGYAQTWMMYDIRALQEIYGVDFTTNAGNTVYSWSPGSGNTLIDGSIALQPGGNKIFATIWDGNGIDTYDLSAYVTGVNIDLTPGGHSVFSFGQLADLNQFSAGFEASGNIYNALQFNGDARSLIENAIGGSGNDTMLGNAANNSLVGGAGNDSLDGGSGNDTVDGGTGADTLWGGLGDDLYIVDNAGDVASEVAGGVDTVQSSVTHTLTVNLENLTLTGSANINGTGNDSRNNVINGNTGNNVLSGLAGNDTISGDWGNDTLYGGDGNDRLEGGFDVDTVYGENGDDLIVFGDAAASEPFFDNVDGGAGTDTLDASLVERSGDIFDFEAGTITGWTGVLTVANIEVFLDGSGGNTIVADGDNHAYYGNGGDDYMIAEIGGETMDGGVGGTDTIDLSRWNGIYSVNMTTGASNWGGELYTNFENLISGNGSDTITGTAGNNVITTNGGDDSINGGGGSDTIDAGAGNDVIVDANSGLGDSFDGGAGVDTLIADFTWVDAVIYDLTLGWMKWPGAGGTTYDTILNIENLTIGGGADVVGSTAANVITVLDTGFDHNNTISTLAGNDTVSSGIGNDSINAGSGSDSVNAGDGNDVITDTETMLASEDDVYDGGAGTDTLVHDLNWVSSVSFDLTAGFSSFGGNRDQLISIENLTVGGSASVRGNAVANVLIVNGTGNNVINGEAGNDTIDGGGGNDTINAGPGNDSVVAGDGNDIITDTETMLASEDDVYNGGAGTDTLVHDLNWVSSVSFDLTTGFSSFGGNRDQLISIENLTVGGSASVRGNAVANVLIVNGTGNNLINGEGGNDTIDGGGGNDTISAGTGNDSVIAGDGADEVNGDDGIDTLWGGLGNDTLWGAGSGVVTDGGDVINGEAGNDLIGGSYGNDLIDGGADNDSLYGDEGNDTLLGGAGADYIQGDWGWGLDPTGADSIDGGDGNDTLLGGAANDTIIGGAGNDSINGGTGDDSMAGGLGDDSYIVDSALDVVTESLNQGLDTVYTVLATYTLTANVENLTLNGAGSQTGYGNKLANIMLAQNGAGNWLEGGANTDSLVGGNGNDRLIGGTGVDTMVGGLGDDRYSVDGADVIVELLGQGTELVDSIADFFTLPDNVENLANRLTTGLQYGRGNALDNLMTGNSADDDMIGYDGNDTIVGNVGNDTLNGGGGNDTVSGGDGNDSLLGGDGNDSLTGGSGDDTMNGNAGNDTLAGGDGNDSMIGFSGSDSITGGAGNDTLSGGADSDTLAGGLGDDDYVAVSSADTLTEFNGQGYDRVFSNSSLTLPTHFEYLELVGGANGTGNTQDNTLVGNASNNTLSGLGGVDILYGRGGNDNLYAGVDAVEDQFVFDTALNAATNVDTLFEAEWGEDQILLDNDIFTALVPAVGVLNAGMYFEGVGLSGNGALDGIGIWYNLTSGGLYYNPTAAVAGDSILFAIVNGASPTLSNLDFTMFSD
ncbi:MAG: hypothetical protein JNL87_17995 [Burkholderiaceae bacterium]|nr:hypothetical protein [Burkholderiaceae bacterium]